MKRILIFVSVCFLLAFFGRIKAEERPFITVWKVDDATKSVTFPGLGKYTLKYRLVNATEYTDLGSVKVDGPADRKVIDFPTAGEYEVVASHTITGLYARGAKAREALALVKQWGTAKWTALDNAFEGCKNMNIDPAAGIPDLKAVKSLVRMFASCATLTADLENWDVSKVENFTATFASCTQLKSELGQWDVSKAKTFANMFSGCKIFNKDLSAWKDKLSSCTKMTNMFRGCEQLEGVSLKDWDVATVQDMGHMFDGCVSFKGDLSAWNVGAVTNMAGMFAECELFQADLKNWDVAAVTDMKEMFKNCRQFNCDLKLWNVAKVADMEGMFTECFKFHHTLKDWDLSGLVKANKKIGIAYVDYDEAKVEELLSSWKAKNYKNLEIAGNGLYYTSAFAPIVKELTKGMVYRWRLSGFQESKDGQFKFTEKRILLKRGEYKEMPSFEGKFLSHRVLVMQREPSAIAQTWRITDLTEKAKEPGVFLELKENRDVELVAVFQKEDRPKPAGKHYVQLNIFGSGKGNVTGNLGSVAVQTGDNLIDNTTEECELQLVPELGSKFTSVTIRSEDEDKNDEPTGYYRFGGENVKIKIPKTDRNLVVDVMFDLPTVTPFSANDYKLYLSTVGGGKGKIGGKIAGNDIVVGSNTVKKADQVNYNVEPETGSVLERLLIIEKDTRIFATGVGSATWSLKYEDRMISEGGGQLPDPIKAPDSRRLSIIVLPSPLTNMELMGLPAGTSFEWFVGKSLLDDFGKPGQPSLKFTPENATNKSISWSFEPNINEEYIDLASLRAKKGTPTGVKIHCIGISNADPSLKVEFDAVLKEKLVDKILVGSIPNKIWTTGAGTSHEVPGEGLELGEKFTLKVEVQPEDASNKDFTVKFEPADVLEDLGNMQYRALKLADKVTMKVTSKSSSAKKNEKEFKIFKIPVDSIHIRKPISSIELKKHILRIRWKVYPLTNEEKGIKGATIRGVRFEVSDTSILKPQFHLGNFKLYKAGKCDIKIISIDDPSKQKTLSIEVIASPGADVEDALLDNITVAPNPFVNEIRIKNALQQGEDIQYNVLNAQGVVVRRGNLQEETEIATQDLAPGLYLLQLSGKGRSRTWRIVKE